MSLVRRLMMLVPLLAACVMPQQVARRQARATFAPEKRDEVWSRALSALQTRGYIIAVSDKAGGLIATQTMQIAPIRCGFSHCEAREVVQITVTPDGTAIVRINREMLEHFGGSDWRWHEPWDDASRNALNQEQDELLWEALGSAGARPKARAGQGCGPTVECEAGVVCFSSQCIIVCDDANPCAMPGRVCSKMPGTPFSGCFSAPPR